VSKRPFPYTNRDYVLARWDTISSDEGVCLEYSIGREDRPPVKPLVRAELLGSAFIIENGATPAASIFHYYFQERKAEQSWLSSLNLKWTMRATKSLLAMLTTDSNS